MYSPGLVKLIETIWGTYWLLVAFLSIRLVFLFLQRKVYWLDLFLFLPLLYVIYVTLWRSLWNCKLFEKINIGDDGFLWFSYSSLFSTFLFLLALFFSKDKGDEDKGK